MRDGPNSEEFRLQAIELLERILFTTKKTKLYLLLDLDNTLIHCRRDAELNLTNAVPSLLQNAHCFRGDQPLPHELFHIDMCRNGKQTNLLVKMRPHAQRFLQEINEMFEIRIVSKGHREYVESALDILDPERAIFVKEDSICMEDLEATGVDRKANSPYDGKNKYIQQCLDNLGLTDKWKSRPEVLIIDDTDQVWCDKRDQVHIIKVDRYNWLDEHKEELGRIANGDEADCSDFDEQLLYLIEPLKLLYRRCVLETRFLPVPSSLAIVRGEVLKDVVICYSGIRPDVLSSQGFSTIATTLGARITNSVDDPSLTHLIAKKNTEKVKTVNSSERRVVVVFPLWIAACNLALQKVDVAPFDVKKMRLDKETGNFICPHATVWETINIKQQPEMNRVRLRKVMNVYEEIGSKNCNEPDKKWQHDEYSKRRPRENGDEPVKKRLAL
eukprot:GEMP01029135.1.p1 GENE.GEMP01029135.1~~GEMP01029135.1.p1  ORF type:complete len:443 (+),score=72.91 GEMP01029135.1:17-1345(+)